MFKGYIIVKIIYDDGKLYISFCWLEKVLVKKS